MKMEATEENMEKEMLALFSVELFVDLPMPIQLTVKDFCAWWWVPLTQLRPNVFGQITAFSVACKMANISLFVDIFLRFYLLDLRTDGQAFHVTLIKVEGNHFINFLVPLNSFHEWHQNIFFMIHQLQRKFPVTMTKVPSMPSP